MPPESAVSFVLPRNLAAAASFFIPLAIYVASQISDVSYWDTAEMQAVPYVFGIAHPTGFPAFIIAGWLASHLIPFGTVAWRIGLVSAVAMAATAYFVYATVVELDETPAAGAAAALLFGVGEIVWTRASRAEPHALAVAFAALAIWSLLRWRRTGSGRELFIAAFAYGLALATHPVAVLMAAGMAWLLFPCVLRTPPRTLLAALGVLVLPGLLYLYIPLRAAYLDAHCVDPMTGFASGACAWNYADPATPANFWAYLTGGDFKPQIGAGFLRMLSPAEYPAVLSLFGPAAVREFGIVALVFAAVGLAALVRSRWSVALGLFLASMPCVPYAFLYPANADIQRYLLTAYWLIAVLAAVGVGRLAVALLGRVRYAPAYVTPAILGGLALWLFTVNDHLFAGRNNYNARPFVNFVLQRTPDNAVLVADWFFACSFSYVRSVEHGLGNRIPVTGHALDLRPNFPIWLKSRPVFLIQTDYSDDQFRTTVVSRHPMIVRLEEKSP